MLVVCACGARRGELTLYHQLEPAQVANVDARRIRVERVSGFTLPSGRDHPASLWVELELENRAADAWSLAVAEVRLAGRAAIGFADYPSILLDAATEPTVAVAGGVTRRVWVRFDDVAVQNRAAADRGVDDPAALVLDVAGEHLTLSDPARGSPLWSPWSWPYFATLGLGVGGAYGTGEGAWSLDLGLAAHRRFGELDVGVVFDLRAGIDMHRDTMLAAAYGGIGGGLTAGYTFDIDSHYYLRTAVDGLVEYAGHGEIATKPVWLGGELQFGFARRGIYPYRERRTNYTAGVYFRGQGRVTSLSAIDEPFAFGLSLGVVLRGGS
jgi:hypothetical protein